MRNLKSIVRQILPSSGFARNVSLVAGGNAAGQVLALLLAPVLTRLYTPADFGILGVYMSLTTITGVIVCFRYNIAIPLPTSHGTALKVAYISLTSTIIVTSICAILVAKYAEIAAPSLGLKGHSHLLYFLPVSTFFLGVFKTLEFWSVRRKKFANIGIARVQQVGSSLASQLIAHPLGPLGLVFGQLANQTVGCLRLKKQIETDGFTFFMSPQALFKTAARYKRFPLLSTWAALLNRTNAQMPTLLFAAFFGPAIAGFYALSMRVINAPSGMLSKALIAVFISGASESQASGNLRKLTEETHTLLAMTMMPVFFYLMIISPDLFSVVFGSEWTDSGKYAQLLSAVVYCSVTIAPLMVLFSVLQKQSHELVFQTCYFLARALALYVGWLHSSAYLALALFCSVGVVFNLLFLAWASRQFQSSPKHFFNTLSHALLISILYSLPALFSTYWASGTLKLIGLVVSAALVFYSFNISYKKYKL